MREIPDSMLYQGVSIDVNFGTSRPMFGDLFLICGDQHPRFPPSSRFSLDSLADLQFEQIDDFFGVRSLNDQGDDVPIWLYPLADTEPVHHHPGPFDGVRLDYSILRNPAPRADHYIKCVARFATFGAAVSYRSRGVDLGLPPDLSRVREDIDAVVRYWDSQGVVVGSSESLNIDY